MTTTPPPLSSSDRPLIRKISRLGAVRALHHGIDAARSGKPVTACPFQVNGNLTEQFLAMWWVKGWRRAADPADHHVPPVDGPATGEAPAPQKG